LEVQTLGRALIEAGGTYSYLDVLPEEVLDIVLDIVLRLLSRMPKAKNWESYIPLDLIVELCGVQGELGRGLKTRFHTLCISTERECTSERDVFGWKLRPEGMAWTNDLNVAHQFILAGGGGSIETLILCHEAYDAIPLWVGIQIKILQYYLSISYVS